MTEAIAPRFILDPALDPNKYIMTNSLRDADKWKAYTYQGQAFRDGTGKKGTMGAVSYVMISKTTNKIIPIAIGDEHHHGFDMLETLTRSTKKTKGLNINVRDYFPLNVLGTNYIYSEEEVPLYMTAIKKALSYGCRNCVIEGAYSMNGKSMTFKQFVESNGDMTIKPGQIGHLGQILIDKFKALAQALARARKNPNTMRAAGKAAMDIVDYIKTLGWNVIDIFKWDEMEKWPEMIQHFVDEEDENGLAHMFFDYKGIKTRIHHHLKEIQKGLAQNPNMNSIAAGHAINIWGTDLKLAIDMLTDSL